MFSLVSSTEKAQREHNKLDRSLLSSLAPWPDYGPDVWERLTLPGQTLEILRASGLALVYLAVLGVLSAPITESELTISPDNEWEQWWRTDEPWKDASGTESQFEPGSELDRPHPDRDDRLPVPSSRLPRGRV